MEVKEEDVEVCKKKKRRRTEKRKSGKMVGYSSRITYDDGREQERKRAVYGRERGR